MSHPTLELKKAYLALRHALDQTVRHFDLTSAQFDVVQLLLHNDGIEHRELQKRLAITSPTLTNILDVLERNDHVERRIDSSDGRIKTLHLTKKTKLLCSSDEFCSAGDKIVAQMFSGFSEVERQDFMTALKRVERNLQDLVT